MSVEVRTSGPELPAEDVDGLALVAPADARDRRRLNLAGDLRTLFRYDPVFRRAVIGYDRFQVDSYVQWAEEELAGAERERAALLTRHVRLREALDEARRQLSHSPGGRDAVQVSYRVGTVLAAAADQADGIRADAEAERAAAAAEAQRVVAEAHAEAARLVAEATAEAARVVAGAAAEAGGILAEAREVAAEAERTLEEARTEAGARLEKVRALEQRAADEAERSRQESAGAAHAARLQARDEVVRMLTTAREERRRADDEAAAARARLDSEAAVRRALLLAEVAELDARHELAAGVPAPREVPAEPLASGGGGQGGRWRSRGRGSTGLHLTRRRG
jgi:cell division septum initiation protein DivIVA